MSHDLEPYRPLIEAINALESELSADDDAALRKRAHTLQQHATRGEPLADLLEEAFALVREVSHRTIGLRPFDVQIAGGIVLHEGHVAEMQTGEGKTLAAVAPVFLNALTGGGVHVLTFNDYLARRDAAWMGPVYEFLGLSVGVVQEGMGVAERQQAYSCDITYLTAKEAGFDLLRDGLCLERSHQAHRPFHFALVDEADSILIDEARIPLVIAGATADETVGLGRLSELARNLKIGTDFDTDEHAHNIFLTDGGTKRVEELLDCDNLFATENVNLMAAVRNALHAEVLLRRDVDYIVRDGSVELIDELTGRVAENRHWPDGLQAAVEAKEGLRLGAEGRILGSITLQHFLQLYPHLCGMTATALPAADELSKTYGLYVVVIPPNRPCIRVDHPDHIFAGREARDRAVVEEIRRANSAGRPVLVGTASVAESELLVIELVGKEIPCQVLNAKNDEREAAIVADAGAPGAVTISTNMAGRGTDIRLGGHEEQDRDQILALSGLYLIGTHRHESRRIDDQLRGRAGRQGDPGSSRFFISLDDDLLQRYGIERLIPRKLIPAQMETPIDSPVIRRQVERVQRVVEGESANVRRKLYDYSTILEDQRRYVAGWRQTVLEDPASLDLLEHRHPTLWHKLRSAVGEETLSQVASRLTLLTIDRCWSEYLTEMQAVRHEIHLVALDGREPLPEFYRTAIQTFERLLERIDKEIVETFPDLKITAEGVDWERHGLRGPSATWTYLVSDNVFDSNVLLTLANRPSLALGAIFAYPLLLLWGIYLHWQKRKKKSGAADRDRED
ncbi:MAG: accessory Sec system translocase SecA2 [Thermoanaerobaculia bacterium]